MPNLTWDAASGRYRDTDTGQWVSRARVRREVDLSLANLTRMTDTLADDLRAGRISLSEWRASMREAIKQVQLGSTAVAKGGLDQMTQADFGRVGQRIRTEYDHLERWVEQIKAGAPFDQRVESRARQYLRSGRSTYLGLEARDMAERGYLARSVTRPAEHCAECLAEAEKGLVPVDQIVPVGQRTCLSNCKCFLVFERAA